MKKTVLAASLAFCMLGAEAQQQPAAAPVGRQAIPDAPKPQGTLPDLGSITPGKGTTATSSGDDGSDASGSTPAAAPAETADEPPANEPPPLLGAQALEELGKVQTITGPGANLVQVPFTVKDSKGRLVAGLNWRDIEVKENGYRQSPVLFSSDPRAISVALVIDQSMTHDDMERVNDSLGAVQGAFAPYDEMAIFTYNNGPRQVTEFSGSQTARITASLEKAKGTGRDALLPGSLSGPMSQPMTLNGQVFDPNVAANRGSTNMQMTPQREVHTLNDAILAAATSLSRRSTERLRVVYVISNGREDGSEAKFKDVVRYLQSNNIEVWGTLVGDSALPVTGFLDKIHLPLMMRDNILPAYAKETGGNFDAEFRTGAIERSFADIAKEVRNQYTIGYYTHEPFLDGKYRKIEVIVMHHGNDLTVLAKPGYYPSAMQTTTPRTAPAQ